MTATSSDSLRVCGPRFGTPRTPGRPTHGARVGKIARALGTPLMPWQQYVADVALEYDADTGRLVYGEVDLTVPRQSGKTTLVLAIAVDRALNFGARQNIAYTAQTRNDARMKWEEEHVATLQASIFAPLITVKLANGQESIRWKNGSRHGITASTEKSGHGATLDLGFIDEAFAQIDARLEQAMVPAMITRPEPQLWVPSTAGTETSAYLRRKVEAGRARVEAGEPSRVAYFEWSAPDDADPGNPRVWRACMPAMGHTIREEAIRARFESMELPEFCRAFLNQWVDRSVGEWVIPKDFWRACVDPGSRRVGGVVFCADVAPGAVSASIAVAGLREDGLPHVEVVAHGPGTDWLVPKMVELQGRHETFCDPVVDPAGPIGALLPDMRLAGLDPVLMTARDQVQACGALYGKAKDTGFRHIDQKQLNDALAGARKRELGDAWALRRKDSACDISPLVAVTGALWGLDTFRIETDGGVILW